MLNWARGEGVPHACNTRTRSNTQPSLYSLWKSCVVCEILLIRSLISFLFLFCRIRQIGLAADHSGQSSSSKAPHKQAGAAESLCSPFQNGYHIKRKFAAVHSPLLCNIVIDSGRTTTLVVNAEIPVDISTTILYTLQDTKKTLA